MSEYKPHVITWLKRRQLHATRLEVKDGKATLYYKPDPPTRAARSHSDLPTRKIEQPATSGKRIS